MLRYLFVVLMLSSAVVTAENASTKFNVRAFGATGDGVADDQPALTKAVVALTQNKGGTLEFPRGVYRCARQAGMRNAIEFVGISNVTISFDPGAVLLMDNLNPQSGMGDFGHGIVFRGPSHDITLNNVSVKWAKKPGGRSMGDAFRFEGFPDERKCISNIRMVRCSAEFSPQTGAVLMGCSDIDVEDFRVTRTYADGLHFNACRRVRVSGVTGVETGDDTLSFVTYQDDSATNSYNGYPGAFARADFGEWNSNDSTATKIHATGGTANGVRLAGAVNVSLSDITVEGKLRGVISDCGKKEGNKHSWSWLASRGITISNVVATGCTSGFYVANFNQPMNGDDKWWRFGIKITDLTAKNCTDDSLLIKDAAGVEVRNVSAENKRIRIIHARDCSLDGIQLENGFLDIHNCRGLTCEDVRITHAIGQAVRTNQNIDCRISRVSVK